NQPRLFPGERLEHLLANLVLGPSLTPYAQVVDVAAKHICGRAVTPSNVIILVANPGEAAGAFVCADEHAVEVDPGAALSGDRRDVAPLVVERNPPHFDAALCARVVDAK